MTTWSNEVKPAGSGAVIGLFIGLPFGLTYPSTPGASIWANESKPTPASFTNESKPST